MGNRTALTVIFLVFTLCSLGDNILMILNGYLFQNLKIFLISGYDFENK